MKPCPVSCGAAFYNTYTNPTTNPNPDTNTNTNPNTITNTHTNTNTNTNTITITNPNPNPNTNTNTNLQCVQLTTPVLYGLTKHNSDTCAYEHGSADQSCEPVSLF